MAEYNLGFSENLIKAARFVSESDDKSEDAARTVLYLSCLACEISLKALLEYSGKPVPEIRKFSHNLAALLKELGNCKVEVPIVKDFLAWVPATRLRAVTVDERFANATVGTILSAEEKTAAKEKRASKYPNEMRYGSVIRHYPHQLVLETAVKVTEWAQKHKDKIVQK